MWGRLRRGLMSTGGAAHPRDLVMVYGHPWAPRPGPVSHFLPETYCGPKARASCRAPPTSPSAPCGCAPDTAGGDSPYPFPHVDPRGTEKWTSTVDRVSRGRGGVRPSLLLGTPRALNPRCPGFPEPPGHPREARPTDLGPRLRPFWELGGQCPLASDPACPWNLGFPRPRAWQGRCRQRHSVQMPRSHGQQDVEGQPPAILGPPAPHRRAGVSQGCAAPPLPTHLRSRLSRVPLSRAPVRWGDRGRSRDVCPLVPAHRGHAAGGAVSRLAPQIAPAPGTEKRALPAGPGGSICPVLSVNIYRPHHFPGLSRP